MKNFTFLIIILSFAIFILSSCEDSTSQYVKINKLESGEKPNIIFLTSEKDNLEVRAEEIKKKLETEINGNKKIIIIKTVYKDNYLFGGEIIFVPIKEMNNLKVKFISTKDTHPQSKDKNTKELFLKSIAETDNIKAVQSVYQSGFLIGGEIYFY